MEEKLRKFLGNDLKIDVLNGRYYRCRFNNIKYLDTKDLEHQTKTKIISIKYDEDEWEMLLERWI